MIQAADQPPDFLIVGASTRAAAHSALRAGYRPACIDRFADADLQAVCLVMKVNSVPDDLHAAAGRFPKCPVLYVGPLDRHAETIRMLSEGREVFGNTDSILEELSDPLLIADELQQRKLPVLEVTSAENPPAPDGAWLRKPICSGGGFGISVWNESAAKALTQHSGHYFQRRVEGRNCSAVFIAHEGIGDVRFVGITEQLVGEKDFGAPPFAWCGNVGPITLSISAESQIRRIANYLKWKFHLLGLFGIDFIVSEDDTVYPIEVNPRYTGSVELLEFSTGQSLLADHLGVFGFESAPKPEYRWSPRPDRVLAKGIAFSSRDTKFNSKVKVGPDQHRTWSPIADIPVARSSIRGGQPICSFFAEGQSQIEAKKNLRKMISQTLRAT